MDYQALGERIRERRRELNLTQSELAEAADLSMSFMGHIERGTRASSLDTLVALCNALRISPTELLTDSLSPMARGEGHAFCKELATEFSYSVMERFKEWNENHP